MRGRAGDTNDDHGLRNCCLTSSFLCPKSAQHGYRQKEERQKQGCRHHPCQLMEDDRICIVGKRQKILSPSPQYEMPCTLSDQSPSAASKKYAVFPMRGRRPSLMSLSRTITTSAHKDDTVEDLIKALSTSSWSSSEEHEGFH
ncbi:hypothetical protein TcBrA4_0132190 [Trypanosoma cruzi]|nr:hypothetical protein TcBrA4_0132190 [Trypanosoma cruzi]